MDHTQKIISMFFTYNYFFRNIDSFSVPNISFEVFPYIYTVREKDFFSDFVPAEMGLFQRLLQILWDSSLRSKTETQIEIVR